MGKGSGLSGSGFKHLCRLIVTAERLKSLLRLCLIWAFIPGPHKRRLALFFGIRGAKEARTWKKSTCHAWTASA